MSRPNEPVCSETNEDQRGDPAKRLVGNARVEKDDERNDRSHRERMSDRDRRQGTPNRGTPLFLETKSNRKEPTHPRIYSMEGAQSEQRQPRPGLSHG